MQVCLPVKIDVASMLNYEKQNSKYALTMKRETEIMLSCEN